MSRLVAPIQQAVAAFSARRAPPALLADSAGLVEATLRSNRVSEDGFD